MRDAGATNAHKGVLDELLHARDDWVQVGRAHVVDAVAGVDENKHVLFHGGFGHGLRSMCQNWAGRCAGTWTGIDRKRDRGRQRGRKKQRPGERERETHLVEHALNAVQRAAPPMCRCHGSACRTAPPASTLVWLGAIQRHVVVVHAPIVVLVIVSVAFGRHNRHHLVRVRQPVRHHCHTSESST
jgi:hypothetical protein